MIYFTKIKNKNFNYLVWSSKQLVPIQQSKISRMNLYYLIQRLRFLLLFFEKTLLIK